MNIGSVGSAGNAWATQMQRGGPPPGARMQAGQDTQGVQGARNMEDLFARIDSDGDGNITQGEFEAFQPTESSGSTSAASSFNVERSTSDFAAQRGGGPGGMHGPGGAPPGPPPSLSDLDADEDGSITADEFGISGDSTDTKATELFNRIDSDGSGDLSSEEVSAFESMMAEQRTQGPGGPPPPGMGGGDPLSALDSDDDGAIGAEEFGLEGATVQMQQLFDAIDGDEDGSLSAAELKSFHEQMQALQVQHYAQVATHGVAADASALSTTA